jgi:hypothetical protein
MKRLSTLCFAVLSAALAPCFAVTSVNFSTLADRNWVFVSTPIAHVYGDEEVSWTYDSYHKKFLRVGGCTGGYTNEVYAYWFDANGQVVSQQVMAPGTDGGSNRAGLGCSRGICYDSKRHIVWNYGGLGSPPSGVSESGQNWALMGIDLGDNSWRMAPNSDAVQLKQTCQIAYDPDDDAIILFGNDMGAWGNCWLYEFSTSKWRQIGALWNPAGPKGNPTYKHLKYDPDNHAFVVLMGTPGDPQTWVFKPSTMTDWEVRRPNPTPLYRYWYAMSYDPANHKLLLHGGDSTYGYDGMNDTWSYDAGANTWTNIPDAGSSRLPVIGPPGWQTNGTVISWQARCPAWAYDSEHNAFVMQAPRENGYWVYRLGSGTSISYSLPRTNSTGLRCSPNPFSLFTSFTLDAGTAESRPEKMAIFSIDGKLIQILGDRKSTRLNSSHP